MSTLRPGLSEAAKLTSSSSFSITVCRRRAPMFSTVSLISADSRASSSIASSLKSRSTFSVASSALYCFTRLASGSVRMRRKSSWPSDVRLTRIGRRPCSSGSMSDGLARWKAPEQMNSTWSVFTGPCLVFTVVPSISGSRSRCTPSRLTSPPPRNSARADLVDLVDEDNAVLLDHLARLADHALLVEHLVALFLEQDLVALRHRHLALLGAPAERLAQHVADVDHADRRAGLARHLELHRRAGVGDLDLDLAVVELAVAQLVAEAQPGVLAGVGAAEGVDDAVFGGHLGLGLHVLAQLLARHLDRHFHQVARDLLDVAADIAHLGELGRLDLEERRVGELGQAPRDLGLAAARGSDHQDILG